MIRPNHTTPSPPAPNGQPRASIPLGTTVNRWLLCTHAAAVCRDTAANRVSGPFEAWIADSSHGVGGVCTVVSMGVDNVDAMATGR